MPRAQPAAEECRRPAAPTATRRAALLAALGGLGGCAPEAAAPVATGPCTYGAGETVTLVVRDQRVLAPVRLANGTALLLLDTSATGTMITPATALRLNLAVDPERRASVRGVGGWADSRRVMAEAELGGIRFGLVRLDVLPLPSVSGQPPDGLLGLDLLGRFDLDLDLAGRRLVLHPQPGRCALDAPPWAGLAFRTLPVERRGNRLLCDVLLDGQLVRARLATGAAGSLLSETAARRIGVSDARIAAGPVVKRRGVDGADREARVVRFAELRIGEEVLRNVPLEIGQASIGPEAEMLLGLDWAGQRRLWISYAEGRVFVAARPA